MAAQGAVGVAELVLGKGSARTSTTHTRMHRVGAHCHDRVESRRCGACGARWTHTPRRAHREACAYLDSASPRTNMFIPPNAMSNIEAPSICQIKNKDTNALFFVFLISSARGRASARGWRRST